MSERDETAHGTSLAVWEVTSPVVARCRASLKAGITCSCGCNLAGTRLEVYNEAGVRVGGAVARPEPWPGTQGLYWASIDVTAPDAEGDHIWTVGAAAHTVSDESGTGTPHEPAIFTHRFVVSRAGEHTVTVAVVEKGSGAPVPGVELRMGMFKATTSDAGTALLHVPRGTYDVIAWKMGYELQSQMAHVGADRVVQLELIAASEPEHPYWM